MNKFVLSLRNDICFQGIVNIEKCIQLVYILSGCDYISYFKGFGKKTFLIYSENMHISLQDLQIMDFFLMFLQTGVCIHFTDYFQQYTSQGIVLLSHLFLPQRFYLNLYRLMTLMQNISI